ncbi:helix-turn-helix transcriptional regulator [Halorussus halobius]|uniref:helix-turn-helix transcriptional regulator n=1 Tax=Halorussus halobius TaxID=1710537 RepID=UPI001092CA7D|nr:hypothetical protein [Halorussus halobius]
MGTRPSAVLLVAVLCVSAVAGSLSGVATSTDSATSAGAATQTEFHGVTPDTVVMDVQVRENGSAAWNVTYRTRLDDSDTAAAFRSYRADVANNSTTYSRQFVDRMTGTVRSAERATGREMAARNFGVRAEVREFPQRYGVVVYSFEWTGFAGTDDGRLRVGDALSGLFLDEKTRLLVTWPDGYDAATVRPEPDERRTRTAVWRGPTDFPADQPRLVLAPPATGGPLDRPWADAPLGVGLAVVAVLGVGIAGGWWLRRDDRASAGTDGEPPEPPEDLLSNEERVLRLLERRGGRVKQKAVVDELGWTEAKTSQVVGALRDQGEIESFRLGRENVLALPGERQES